MLICTFEDGNQNSLRHVTTSCLIVKDDKLLLAKRSDGLTEGGKWCLPGGYVHRDETANEACVRECREETGWLIENVTLLWVNDNPKRLNETRQNVDFTFIANAIKEVGEYDEESSNVQWFPLTNLPSSQQIAFDHHASIDLYKRYLESKMSIPIYGNSEIR